MPFTVALTGGIASGKSAVGQAFGDLGIEVIDADQVARDVVVPGSAGLAAVVEAFGADVLDSGGHMDRRRMREKVFADPTARQRLEHILHPLIREQLLVRRDAVRSPYGILMVPLFAKFGLRPEVHRVLVVDTDESLQLVRLTQRDGITPALAQSMIAAQESRSQRLAAADDVLDNRGDLQNLLTQVGAFHRQYLQLAGASA